jgi:hypothetical protein
VRTPPSTRRCAPHPGTVSPSAPCRRPSAGSTCTAGRQPHPPVQPGPDQGWYHQIGRQPVQPGTFVLRPHWREDYVRRTRTALDTDRAAAGRGGSLASSERESIDAHLTIVFAALAVRRRIEAQTGWSTRNSSARPPLPHHPDPRRPAHPDRREPANFRPARRPRPHQVTSMRTN